MNQTVQLYLLLTHCYNMTIDTGSFVISLDCELMWGVRDEVNKEVYGQHILGDHQVIPTLLDCFHKFGIKATFASVGFLFFKDKQEMLSHLPGKKPAYKDADLSPYGKYIETEVGNNYEDDKYHFGWPLLAMIKESPGQEIGTHTFSHYYCLEEGQTTDEFEADTQTAITVAKEKDIKIESIIFPRNQVNEEYLDVCRKMGIFAYRGTEKSWIYSARSSKNESLVRRFVRLADAYINLSGHHCYTYEYMGRSFPIDIPSSRFLRPYLKTLKWFEGMRLKRITDSMTYAAKHKLTYHLWWHPHNFGVNQDENFAFLEKILSHYQYLNKKYSFTSKTMSELSKEMYEANK